MRTPTSRTDRRGFTLLELTMVVVIVGVISALVFQRLDSALPRQRLRAAANEVIGLAASARAQARLTGLNVELRYDIDKNTVSIESPYVDPNLPAGEPNAFLSRRMPEGVKLAHVYYAESRVSFNGSTIFTLRPSGAVSEHMVELADTEGDTVSVYVPALTGSPFVVQGGIPYEVVRAGRRLK
jgi:prepilin-type N-terminal cleavage/methylation domain-containing protein